MFNTLVNTILKFIIWLARILVNIILAPITLLLFGEHGLFPDVNSYMSQINTFINNHWFKGLSFMREVFFNLTGFPRQLIGLSATLILGFYAFKISYRAFCFLLNSIKFIRKGE